MTQETGTSQDQPSYIRQNIIQKRNLHILFRGCRVKSTILCAVKEQTRL